MASAKLEACVALQKEVWNFGRCRSYPRFACFVVCHQDRRASHRRLRRQTIWSASQCLFRAPAAGNPYLHSHMPCRARKPSAIAVLGKKSSRFRPGATTLSSAASGFDRVDLRSAGDQKNAWLNIGAAGSSSRAAITPISYGMSSSPLQGGFAHRQTGGRVVA